MSPLGCDNETHAIKTLATIYRVEPGVIDSVAGGWWPDFISESDRVYQEIFNSEYLPSLMASHLKASPNWDFGEVAYYHRSVYNGKPEWFKDGLLASIPGACAFLNKIEGLIDLSELDVDLAIKNIKIRNAYEGISSGGPYAFDIFEDAKSADCVGLDYSLPEFFIGEIWRDRYGAPCAQRLREQLSKVLKPVIVKFSALPSTPEKYINNLWHYIYRNRNGECVSQGSHYPCTFLGNGESVQANKIIQIFDI